MTGKKKNTEKKSISPTRGAMIVIAFVAAVLLVVLAINSINLQKKISDNEATMKELQSQIKDEEERSTQIDDLEEYMQSDEYLEQEAKDKLGFVKDGEIIFKESK